MEMSPMIAILKLRERHFLPRYLGVSVNRRYKFGVLCNKLFIRCSGQGTLVLCLHKDNEMHCVQFAHTYFQRIRFFFKYFLLKSTRKNFVKCFVSKSVIILLLCYRLRGFLSSNICFLKLLFLQDMGNSIFFFKKFFNLSQNGALLNKNQNRVSNLLLSLKQNVFVLFWFYFLLCSMQKLGSTTVNNFVNFYSNKACIPLLPSNVNLKVDDKMFFFFFFFKKLREKFYFAALRPLAKKKSRRRRKIRKQFSSARLFFFCKFVNGFLKKGKKTKINKIFADVFFFFKVKYGLDLRRFFFRTSVLWQVPYICKPFRRSGRVLYRMDAVHITRHLVLFFSFFRKAIGKRKEITLSSKLMAELEALYMVKYEANSFFLQEFYANVDLALQSRVNMMSAAALPSSVKSHKKRFFPKKKRRTRMRTFVKRRLLLRKHRLLLLQRMLQ